MAKNTFKLNYKDEALDELIKNANHKALATWAVGCVERVMPLFEEKYPDDKRPREALVTLKAWILTGIFRMNVIRASSLSAHAAAREVGEDNAARSVARAAGQAVASAHVRTHALGASLYALQAIHRASNELHADAAVTKEREWQRKYLNGLSSITL